ncbi:ShlB/FhaC/HecB family hemolysin secretion/activation protein [Aquisediminimonas sediminicola]|uniref:ShlB/FhaC/HecB family hemolysin secretion/activation protein n=1 Tax=Alteraquisediminimonas sediminicola TaxID=2676787 RepID=UPI001C8DC549|nr:ShlB/FhaC/HecB family hemolysin secretion/activation protein [Aquisediminimonas sediminicola]
MNDMTHDRPPAAWQGSVLRSMLLCSGVVLALGSSGVAAQVLERNLPPAPTLHGQPMGPDSPLSSDQDDRPIGAALKAVVLLATSSDVLVDAASGIDTHRVARLDNPAARAILAPYLGRPLSRRLIGELQIAITRYYRARGFPFLSVSIPEQEVTQGILQIRVIEFTAGEIEVVGNPRPSASYIKDHIRQRTNAPIDVRILSQDLNWLNRNPFRNVETLFSPGDGLGRTNLTLSVADTKPWRVYAGISNSGSSATGRNRLFAGFEAAPVRMAPDLRIAYQFTGSDDLLDGDAGAYRSHAGIVNFGIAPRQSIDLTLAHIETRQANGPFDITQQTSEAVLGWRQASGAWGDLEFGVEARRSKRQVAFGDIALSTAQIDVIQLYANVENAMTDRLGTSYLSLTVHVSPGGIGRRNGAKALTIHTNGRVTDSRYGYVEGSYARSIRLGRARLSTELIGHMATGPLPDSEQFGIGASGYVRGYSLDDGGYDAAVVLRNALYAPSWSMPGQQVVQPYLFVDAGYARQWRTQKDMTPFSLGAGAQYQLGRAFAGSVYAARAMTSAPRTNEGDWRMIFSARVSY